MSLLLNRDWRRRRKRAVTLVRVSSRFEPETIFATAGERIMLRFRRESSAASGAPLGACCSRVIFPALGRSIELPLYDEVVLELLLERPGRYEFTCEHGIHRGVLEVEERRPASSPSFAARRNGNGVS